MKKRNNLCGKFKPYVDEYGTHINIYYHEQTGTVPAGTPDDSPIINRVVGESVAKVTYHVTTHSITIGKRIKDGYTVNDIALEFVRLLKESWFQDYIKDTADINEVSNKPVWCKQLGKHFM